VIGEKLAKPRKKVDYADKDALQFFYEIVQYWVAYDLVKIIVKYGLMPDYNDNLKIWSSDIYDIVSFLRKITMSDNQKIQGKLCLDTFYETSKTVHWTQFGRCGLGTRKHLQHGGRDDSILSAIQAKSRSKSGHQRNSRQILQNCATESRRACAKLVPKLLLRIPLYVDFSILIPSCRMSMSIIASSAYLLGP
jgi:hypothetical protein